MMTPYINNLIVDSVSSKFQIGCEAARKQLQHAFIEARRTKDFIGEANVLWQLGLLEIEFNGDLNIGRQTLAESLIAFDEAGAEIGKAHVMLSLSSIARLENRLEEAEKLVKSAATIFTKHNDPIGNARVLDDLGRIANSRRDFVSAEKYWRESLPLLEKAGDLFTFHHVNLLLGELRNNLYGDVEQGKQLITQSVNWFEGSGYLLVAQAARKKFANILTK